MALVTLGLVWYFWTDGTLGVVDYGATTDFGSYGYDARGYVYNTGRDGGYGVVVVRRLKKTVEIIGYELTVGEFVAIQVAIVAILVAIVGIVVQVILGRRASARVLRRRR